jgi:hypothetical protein
MPIIGRDSITARIREFHKMAEEAGREPRGHRGRLRARRGRALGAPRSGVSRAIFGVPAADRETVLPLLDRCAKLLV